MSENLDNNDGNDEKNNPNDSAWDELMDAPSDSAEQESQNAELSEVDNLERTLESFYNIYSETSALLSDDERDKLKDICVSLETRLEEAKERAATNSLPESKREAFAQYCEKNLVVKSDAIDAVLMRARGKTNEEIRDFFMSQDYGGADEEINKKRGDSVYQGLIEVIGENNEE